MNLTEPDESTVFMGMCQRHQAARGGTYLPGCPPHAEEIINGIFQFYKDVERPKYADQTEEAKTERTAEVSTGVLKME